MGIFDRKNGKARGEFTERVRSGSTPAAAQLGAVVGVSLTFVVGVLATLTAAALTAVAVVTVFSPHLLDGVTSLSEDYKSNIAIGAAFFWIEVAMIVIFIDALDRSKKAQQRKAGISLMARTIGRLEVEVQNLRIAFATELDSKSSDGELADADFNIIPVGLDLLRGSLMAHLLNQKDFGFAEGKFYNRIMRALDRGVVDTRDFADKALVVRRRVLNAGDKASAEDRAALLGLVDRLLDYDSTAYRTRIANLRAEIDFISGSQKRNVFAR